MAVALTLEKSNPFAFFALLVFLIYFLSFCVSVCVLLFRVVVLLLF